jgi:predicted nucleic acid-binding protein
LTLYLDASALFKRYVAEPGSDAVLSLLMADPMWVSANHAYVEISVNLGRRLGERTLPIATAQFERDWDAVRVVAMDDALCRRAAAIGVERNVRTLDALHLAAAERAGGPDVTFVTFDARLGDAARAMGFPVAGA